MTLQGPSDLLRNQDDAAGRTAPVHEPVVTEWAVHPPAPAHPCLPDKVGRASAQQYEARKSKEQLPQQPAQSKTEPRCIPRLRAVVESQAFKNILVDEMDMMLSRAATLIQANWRGYRLRQKLISQMLAAKAIQEAWRRFNTRRLLRSSKVTVKRVSKEEGDIPYHPPQQVRFQPPEDKPLQVQPVMMSKETQFPPSDSLVTCIPQLGLLQHPAAQGMAGPGVQAPHGPGAHGVAFLPHQTIAMRLPSPVSLDPKCQPCLLTKTVRSSCLIRHLEGDTVKTKHITTRATRAGAPEPPPSGRYGQAVPGTFKAQIQAHVEADTHKTPPQAFPASTLSKTPPKTSPLVSITRPQAQVSPISTVTKTPPQTGPGPIMTVMKTLPQTGPSPTVTRTQAQMRQTPSLTNAPLQSRLAATMAKIPPQVCLLASVMRPPPQTCPVSAMTKPTPQIRLVTAPTKNQMQTCQAATVTKTPSQVCPGASIMKPPPQTRLAAMITKTPAQIRSVAAVLRTLCLVPPVVGNLRTPPQRAAGSAGIPSTCSTVHLNAQKGKVMVNVRQTAGVKDSSHSYLAEGKVRSVPQPHLEAGAPKPMARGPLEPEKVRTCLQRQVKKETVSKTNMTMEMTQPLPWTKVAEDRNKSPPQAQQRIELIKVQSQVSVPVEAAAALPRDQMAAPLTKTLGQVRPSPRQAKALPQEQLTTPLTKTLTQLHPATEQAKALSQQAHLATCPPTAMPQPHLATCLTKTTSQVHLTSEQTKVLSQGHLSTTLAKTLPQPPRAAPLMTASPLHSPAKQTKAGPQAHLAPQSPKTPSQVYPPSRLTKTPSLAHLVTCLTKAQSQVHLSSGAVKIQSQAQLPVGLTKTQSQAQLVSQTKSFLTACQSTDLNSKTQSQPLLTGSRASAPSCQHLGAMSFLPRPKSEDRPAQLQPQGHVQSKTTHGPCPVASEAQGMLVPLMTSTGHPTCNIEPWGDSGTPRAQPPVASQAVPCQEAAASQIASLCAELAAVLGSQEDIRALLAKALSQGEVRAALNLALSKDVLGTTVTKAMPQGMLGMALVKALSWGELGITLSRALSRGELRSELTKVMQGKLAEVLSKALTDEERAALGQALCQGELGAVLSQSLSQAALRTGAILPKASSKAVGSGMTLLPASVEVDCRGNASAAWGSAVGPGSPQPSKVRVSQVGGWEDFTMGQHAGLLEEMGDGATLEGSPCSTLFPVGMSLTGRMVPSICHYPMVMGLDLIQPWGRGPAGASYLSPSIKKRSRWLTPGASPATGVEGPHLPKAPRAQPPPSLWQSFIVNGIGPSTSQPSVTCDSTPSSHKPQVVSRVASHSWALSGKGSGAFGRPPGSMGGRRAVHSQPSFPVCQDAACWCQFSGVSRVSPKHSHHRSVIRGQNQLCQAPGEALRRRPQPPGHKPAFHGPRQVVTNMTSSSMRTTMVSKAQAAKCPAGGSLYPGPPALMLGCGLRPRGALTRNPPRPREHVASHQMSLLNELVSSLPQHPDNVLTRNFTPGSVGPRQKIPNLYWRPPTVPPLTPVLSRGPVSSHMALSVHWDSEEQKKNRSSPGQSSLALVERVSQETFRPGLRKSLSLGSAEHQQPSLATKLALNQSQSISASREAPNLAKSILCQLPVGGRLTRSLSQPTVCIKASMAHLGPLSLSQPCTATGLACGLSQPSVIYGVGRGLCDPAPGPRVDPTLQASRVSAGAPGLCPPSVFLSLGSGRSYSCVPGRLGLGLHQPPLDVGVGTCEDPAVADRVVSNLQDAQFSQVSLGLHQPSSVWGRHPTAVSMSAPNLYQTDMTKEVTQGPSMFHSTWLKGMSACSSEGPAAAGMLLSLSQGATPAGLAGSIFQKNMVPSMGPSQCQVTDGLVPMASQVLERGVSLTHGETSMATGMDPSRPRVALPSRLGTSQDPLSVFHLGLRTSQATIPLPMPLDHQPPAVPTVVPSSYPYARIVPEDSVMGTASGSLASSSADRRLTPAMVPNAVANFMACSLSRGSVIRGMGQGLPRGSMVTGMAQGRLLDPTASGMARSLPPGTGAGRVAPHQMAASGAKGKRLGLAMGPLARFTAPSLSPGSVAPGVGPSVPLGSVKTGGQGPPQGSMLIGLTPRPYHGAGEGPAALLQAAHAASLAQVHPQASGAQGTTRAQHRVPTVLSRASPFTQDPRILTLGTIEDPTKLKPRELGGALAQESGSHRESNKSKVLEATPWMYQRPMDNHLETPRGPPRAEETLPKGQMSLLGERAPGQASGIAPIPFRARHSMTSSFSASLQPDSASPRGAPSTYLITTSRARSLQLGTAVDRAMPQPLTPVVSDDFSALQPESVAHMRPPSRGSLTSDIVLTSPHLTSPVASSLYAGSVARTESSGVLQRSGSGNVAPHVQPYQSLVKKAVPGHSQMAPVPSTFQKPVSGNLTQTSLKSLRPKKYYRLIHGKLIPELLEGSMTTVVPSNQGQRQETQSPLASRRHSPCELWVGRTPTVQPSDTAYDPSVTRLSPGVRRVSLGYTTSPSGLWRPLLEQDSHESMRLVTRQHKPFPTPSVHQGQISHHAVGPVAGLHKPSLVPTVLQGPVDAGLASGVPSEAVRPMDHAVAPQSTWETARGPVPWDTLGSVAAVSPRQPGELMVSVQTMEKILVRAVVVIQAFARGYLVRSTMRVWHQCATVIQASWRGFRVRRNLARLYRATTIIQAAWRGYCTRRDCAQQMLLPAVWVELGSKVRAAPHPRCFQGSEARLGSDHRCFQSCQPHICSLCQSLSPGLGNPPSVVMLVGSSPRTCHTCGHTLPTRVVHGTGRSISSQGGLLWACSSPKASQGLCRSPGQNRAAMAIQSAWRGFKTRRQLRQQQSAAKMVQSNWRGHYTRSCLTTDMLLGSGAPRDCSRGPSRHSTHSARSVRWPGV
ncbi:LOW QUALITY PROTEIN: IQ domain-containing protein N [Marmota flaviventris]|uniref:LOW QUALITY PROTEIN: IQ domain-containing protein N n=1 Tax=Marmota flaviventris TaxID=93162 RepID=UPI003A8408A1